MDERRERQQHIQTFLLKPLPVALPVVLIGSLIIHFGFTLLYLTPPNPIKLRLMPVVRGYMEPLFVQNWELFAPDVDADTRHMLVSCRIGDAEGNLEETPWSNMSDSFVEMRNRYRITPADRLARVQLAPLYILFEPEDVLTKKVLEAYQEGSPEHEHIAAVIKKDQEAQQELGKRLLARIASAECDRLYDVGRTREVRIRLVTVIPQPFSKRNQPSDPVDTLYTDFDWMSYEEVARL